MTPKESSFFFFCTLHVLCVSGTISLSVSLCMYVCVCVCMCDIRFVCVLDGSSRVSAIDPQYCYNELDDSFLNRCRIHADGFWTILANYVIQVVSSYLIRIMRPMLCVLREMAWQQKTKEPEKERTERCLLSSLWACAT